MARGNCLPLVGKEDLTKNNNDWSTVKYNATICTCPEETTYTAMWGRYYASSIALEARHQREVNGTWPFVPAATLPCPTKTVLIFERFDYHYIDIDMPTGTGREA